MAAVKSSCAVVLSEQFYCTLYKEQSTRPRMLLRNTWAVLQGSTGLELLHGRVGLGASPPPPGSATGGAGAGGGEIEKLVRPARAVRRDAGAGDRGAGDAEGAREGYCLFPMLDGWGSEGEAARVVTLFLAALSCALASGDAGARIPCAPAPERHSSQPSPDPITPTHTTLLAVSCPRPHAARTLIVPEEAWNAIDPGALPRAAGFAVTLPRPHPTPQRDSVAGRGGGA